MKSMCRIIPLFMLLAIAVIIAGCQNQADTKTDAAAETESLYQSVAEVDVFMGHLEDAVHAAYDTNYTAVRETAPKFTAAYEALIKAVLPEFHNNVEALYKEKQPALGEAVRAFAETAESGDETALDESLTGIRKAFIDLWIVFLPAIQEIEDFHDVLRPAWHEYTPNEDWDALKATMPDFEKATDAIMKVKLPAKYSYAQAKFDEGRNHLKNTIDSLKIACETGTPEDIKAKMSIMHSAYHDMQYFYE